MSISKYSKQVIYRCMCVYNRGDNSLFSICAISFLCFIVFGFSCPIRQELSWMLYIYNMRSRVYGIRLRDFERVFAHNTNTYVQYITSHQLNRFAFITLKSFHFTHTHTYAHTHLHTSAFYLSVCLCVVLFPQCLSES